jgi:DNA-binding NarL/FixJ family response regulator
MSRILVVTDHPVLAHGYRAVLSAEFADCLVCSSVESAIAALTGAPPHVLLLDLTGGLTLDKLSALKAVLPDCPCAIRIGAVSVELILQALELGVQGILSRKLSAESLRASLRKIGGGGVQMDFTDLTDAVAGGVVLTNRELELMDLLERGLKNKEIAHEMHVTLGTAKTYLTRLYQKLGVRNRFEVALYGLKHGTAAASSARSHCRRTAGRSLVRTLVYSNQMSAGGQL